MRFTQTKAGVRLQVHTCKPLFRISGTDGRIALKFGEFMDKLAVHFMHATSGYYAPAYVRSSFIFRDPLDASCRNFVCC